MFEINDMVVHKAGGVFVIKEIIKMNFGKGIREYFVLNPYFSKIAKTNTIIYVPLDSANSLIRHRVSEDVVLNLIDNLENLECEWIHDIKSRKNYYEDVLQKGDLTSYCRVLKTIQFHKFECHQNNKILSTTDSDMYDKLCNSIYQLSSHERYD